MAIDCRKSAYLRELVVELLGLGVNVDPGSIDVVLVAAMIPAELVELEKLEDVEEEPELEALGGVELVLAPL